MSADYEPVSSEERNLDVDFVARAKNDESIVGICYKGFHRSHKYIETVGCEGGGSRNVFATALQLQIYSTLSCKCREV